MSTATMSQQFDAHRPLYISKPFWDDKGNYFPADSQRPYKLNAIPPKYRTSDYLSQGVLKKVNTEEDMARVLGFQEQSSQTRELKASSSIISELEPVNINTARKSDLESLESVGPATASTIVKVREDKKFTSINELDERVPLPRGQKWETLKSAIRF